MTPPAIIQLIHTAFAGVPKPHYTLADAAVADEWGDETERFPESDKAWSEIPDEHISRTTAAFCFLPPASWNYYIPAYMVWSIHHIDDFATESPQHLVYSLTHRDEALAFRDSLSPKQRQAVQIFLDFWRAKYPQDIDDDAITLWYETVA
jgi:hypothetical protein